MPLEVRTHWVLCALEIKEHHNALPHQVRHFLFIYFHLKVLYFLEKHFMALRNEFVEMHTFITEINIL
jgi:hypothetical protein